MIALGIGWFGIQFFWAFQTSSMPLFLKDFTDSKFKISLVISLAGIMGCVVPPIIGYFSDRTHTRFGRRKPYIFFGMLGVLVCVSSLPHVPTLGVVAVVAGLMYFTLVSAESPYMALLPDITPPEQRSTASGVMNLLGSIGLISYFVVGSRIWDTNPDLAFKMVAFTPFGLTLIAMLLIREPAALTEKPGTGTNPLAYIKDLAKETNALKFFIGQAFWWLGLWTVSSFLTLFAVDELGVSEGSSLYIPMAFSIVATVFMLPLGILGDRIGRKGIISVMLVLWAVADVLMVFSQSLTSALVFVGLAGIPFAAVMGVGYAYMLDLIPEERTAEFVGYNYLSQTAPTFLGPLIGGKLIDVMGYRAIFPTAAIFVVIGLIILQFVNPRQDTKAGIATS